MSGWAVPDAGPEQPSPRPGPTVASDRTPEPPLPPVPVPFGPMTLPALLDGAVQALKRRPREFLGVSIGFVVVTQLLIGIAFRDSVSFDFSAFDPEASGPADDTALVDGRTLLVQMLGSVRLLFPTAVITVLVVTWLRGEHVDGRTAARDMARRLPALVIAWILVHVIEAVAIVGVLVGTVVAAVFLQLVTPVIAIEGVGPVDAIRRSFRLVRARFGRAVTVPAALLFVEQASTMSLQALALGLSGLAPADLDWVVLTTASILVDLVFVPVRAASMALLYVDTRVRVEGLDLDDRARRAFDG